MITITRYGLGREYAGNTGSPAITEQADGAYVRYEDHQRLQAACEAHNEMLLGRLKLAEGVPVGTLIDEGTKVGGAPTSVSGGWMLVPVEPSLHQITEAAKAAKQYMDECGGNSPVIIYKTMLAAAPTPPADVFDKNYVIELLATLLHFIPKDEPGIYRDTEQLCAALRDITPPADRQEQQDLINDALYESAYTAGLKAGYNYGSDGDSGGLNKAIEARSGYLKPIRDKQRAAQQDADKVDAPEESERSKYLASLFPEDRMFEAIDQMARESYRRHSGSKRGQMIARADAWDSHVVWATKLWIEQNAPAAAQSDPAMAGDEWLTELRVILGLSNIDERNTLDVMVHARKRVQPASGEDPK